MSPAASPVVVVPPPPPRRAFDTRSEELDEVMAFAPSRLLRSGMYIVAGAIAAALGVSFFVRYPEVVHGRVFIATPSPPVRLVTPSGGPVQHVLVRDSQHVTQGTPLVVLRSSADYQDVERLRRWLSQFEDGERSGRAGLAGRLPSSLVAGDAQPAYSALVTALAERALDSASAYELKASSLTRELAAYERLRDVGSARQKLLDDDRDLAARQHARNKELAAHQFASGIDLERTEGDYLRAAEAAEAGHGASAENDIRIAQTERAVLELRQQQGQDALRRRLAVHAALDGLREAIRRWERQYVIQAPIDGRVSFFRPLDEGEYLAASQPVVAIVPAADRLAGRIALSPADIGRVRPGQRVILRFDAFQAGVFGTVEGRVARVSQVTSEFDPAGDKHPMYFASIDLPRGLVTNNGRRITFLQEMQGTGDIVTDDLRVADRLFRRLRASVDGAAPAR